MKYSRKVVNSIHVNDEKLNFHLKNILIFFISGEKEFGKKN